MPQPALVAINFVLLTSVMEGAHETQWEIEAIWQGLDRKYLGTVTRTREVAIRDDDGTNLVRCRITAMPLTAEFTMPSAGRDSLTPGEAAATKKAARELLAAAYRACGYEVAAWVTA